MPGDPQADPQAPPASGDDGKKTLDDRMGAVETEQREQRGILNRIEAAVLGKGSTPSTSPDSAPGSTSPPASESVAEQVKRGVAEIEAKRKKDEATKAAKDADESWRKSVDERLAERKPAEPRTGRKVKLQERLFGKADAR